MNFCNGGAHHSVKCVKTASTFSFLSDLVGGFFPSVSAYKVLTFSEMLHSLWWMLSGRYLAMDTERWIPRGGYSERCVVNAGVRMLPISLPIQDASERAG
jgi:hypothetical protein